MTDKETQIVCSPRVIIFRNYNIENKKVYWHKENDSFTINSAKDESLRFSHRNCKLLPL